MNRNTNTNSTLATRPAQSVRGWNPWSEFEQMRRQMDELVGTLGGYVAPARLAVATPGLPQTVDFDFSPDIYETNSEFVFVAPIPGLDANDLRIEATENALTIRGERKPFFQQEGATQHRQSWWSARLGAFEVGYTLPSEINPEAVQAHYRNGMLELHLPKVLPNKPKSVKINVLSDANGQAQQGQSPQIEQAASTPEGSVQ